MSQVVGEDLMVGMGYIGLDSGRLYRMRRGPKLIEAVASGTTIIINDATEGRPFRGLRVFGKSTQVQTTGTQLLRDDLYKTVTTKGITIELKNCVVSFKGTFTDDGTGERPVLDVWINKDEFIGKTLKLVSDHPESYMVFRVTNINGESKYDVVEATIDETVKEVVARFFYRKTKPSSGTVINETQKVMLCESKNKEKPWEPYTGGKPSPSPEYPQEIVNVGESGSINVEVGGGNLFKILQHSAGYYTGEPGSPVRKNTNTGYSWEAELLALPGTELTLSVITSIMSRFRCYVIDDNGIILLKHEDSSANSVDYTHTFVVPDRGAKMYLSVMEVSAPEGTTIMLNSGKAVLPYEPYRDPQLLTLQTPNGLPGVSVSKDGNYTDADGQQWVCDEIDLERGKYVQRVVIENISGGWELKPSSDISGRFLQSRLTNTFQTADKTAVCNIASFTSWGTPVNDKYAFALNTKVIYFSPPKGAEITAEELNAKLNSLSFPVVFVGELATPIERDLTPEEIAAYKALRTYGPTTVVSNDAGAEMEITYRKDKKNEKIHWNKVD